MQKFDEAHAAFIQHHLENRSGERRGRLERGHNHAEVMFTKQIWWPLKGSFDGLHPEFEVLDWRGRPYFADFVYKPDSWKLLFEIKGYGAHVTDMDRLKYCNELNREAFLMGMGYHVVSFAYDDVANRPELCKFLLRTILSRFETVDQTFERILFADEEIMRYAVLLARPIRPIDISRHFSIDHRTAVGHLQRLCRNGWLAPLSSGLGQRIRQYEITKRGFDRGLYRGFER